jgi:adenosylcobinamide-GDP ribazoletransferase
VRRALAYLTVLGRAMPLTSRSLTWFPLVGAAIGVVVGGTWWLSSRVWPSAVAATIAVGVDAVITGGTNLAGLADAADGLLPTVDRTKRLEIMADPRIGAFGTVALLLVLALRIATISAATVRPLAVIALWTGSRTLMAVVARTLPNARGGEVKATEGSPTSSFVRDASASANAVAAYGLAIAMGSAVFALGSRGFVMVGAEVVAAILVTWFAVWKLGGYTSDVLGAAAVLGETAGLLALVAR